LSQDWFKTVQVEPAKAFYRRKKLASLRFVSASLFLRQFTQLYIVINFARILSLPLSCLCPI